MAAWNANATLNFVAIVVSVIQIAKIAAAVKNSQAGFSII